MVGIAGAHAGGQTVVFLFLQGRAVDADFLDTLTTGGVDDKSDFHARETHQPAAEAFHGVGGKNVVDFFFQPVEQLLSAYLSGFNVIVNGQHVVNVPPCDGGCSSVFRNYGVAEAEAVGQGNVGTGLPTQGIGNHIVHGIFYGEVTVERGEAVPHNGLHFFLPGGLGLFDQGSYLGVGGVDFRVNRK